MINPVVEKTDTCRYFAMTGNRPHNFVKNDKIDERFRDYPKNERIIQLKTNYLAVRNHPAILLKTSLK